MAEKFGKTWWGEHWLRSLVNVDYDNRLPRGASYARNGRVKDIKIEGNQIVAKVKGNYPSPYKVTIVVPSFAGKDIERLMAKIIERPALISKLLNRELDPAILGIAEELGLKVFPRQWTDFKMNCSCPDWAVPCKHLAAVIYMLCREIDNNPFLVFETHNVNLLDELKKREIISQDHQKTEIPTMENLLKTKDTLSETLEDAVYERIDFSGLQDISQALTQLLTDAPPFYPSGNFRERYAIQLNRIVKDASRILSKKLDFNDVFKNPDKHFLTHRTTLALTINGVNEVEIVGEHHKIKKLEHRLPALFALNPDRLPDFQPSVAAFHKLLLASLHLSANGMIIPQIIQLDDKRFAIRWLPAMMDSRVKTVVEKLTAILPDGLLLFKKIVRKKLIINLLKIKLLNYFQF
jgi:uncharacterized Zn finger protein